MAKITWTPDLLDELTHEKARGKSLSDLVALLYTKFGVQVTPARVSQVLKSYRQQEEQPNAD